MTALIPAWVNGMLTPVDKIGVHRRGLRHKAVSVFVLHDDRMLVQRRALGKYHTPGLWANSCCTHPLWGESTEDCARRRLYQELGVAGFVPAFAGQVEYRADVGGGMIEHEVVDLFTVRAGPELPLMPDPTEVMDTRWIAIADLDSEISAAPDLFTPWLRIYMDSHRDVIFGPAAGSGDLKFLEQRRPGGAVHIPIRPRALDHRTGE